MIFLESRCVGYLKPSSNPSTPRAEMETNSKDWNRAGVEALLSIPGNEERFCKQKTEVRYLRKDGEIKSATFSKSYLENSGVQLEKNGAKFFMSADQIVRIGEHRMADMENYQQEMEEAEREDRFEQVSGGIVNRVRSAIASIKGISKSLNIGTKLKQVGRISRAAALSALVASPALQADNSNGWDCTQTDGQYSCIASSIPSNAKIDGKGVSADLANNQYILPGEEGIDLKLPSDLGKIVSPMPQEITPRARTKEERTEMLPDQPGFDFLAASQTAPSVLNAKAQELAKKDLFTLFSTFPKFSQLRDSAYDTEYNEFIRFVVETALSQLGDDFGFVNILEIGFKNNGELSFRRDFSETNIPFPSPNELLARFRAQQSTGEISPVVASTGGDKGVQQPASGGYPPPELQSDGNSVLIGSGGSVWGAMQKLGGLDDFGKIEKAAKDASVEISTVQPTDTVSYNGEWFTISGSINWSLNLNPDQEEIVQSAPADRDQKDEAGAVVLDLADGGAEATDQVGAVNDGGELPGPSAELETDSVPESQLFTVRVLIDGEEQLLELPTNFSVTHKGGRAYATLKKVMDEPGPFMKFIRDSVQKNGLPNFNWKIPLSYRLDMTQGVFSISDDLGVKAFKIDFTKITTYSDVPNTGAGEDQVLIEPARERAAEVEKKTSPLYDRLLEQFGEVAGLMMATIQESPLSQGETPVFDISTAPFSDKYKYDYINNTFSIERINSENGDYETFVFTLPIAIDLNALMGKKEQCLAPKTPDLVVAATHLLEKEQEASQEREASSQLVRQDVTHEPAHGDKRHGVQWEQLGKDIWEGIVDATPGIIENGVRKKTQEIKNWIQTNSGALGATATGTGLAILGLLGWRRSRRKVDAASALAPGAESTAGGGRRVTAEGEVPAMPASLDEGSKPGRSQPILEKRNQIEFWKGRPKAFCAFVIQHSHEKNTIPTLFRKNPELLELFKKHASRNQKSKLRKDHPNLLPTIKPHKKSPQFDSETQKILQRLGINDLDAAAAEYDKEAMEAGERKIGELLKLEIPPYEDILAAQQRLREEGEFLSKDRGRPQKEPQYVESDLQAEPSAETLEPLQSRPDRVNQGGRYPQLILQNPDSFCAAVGNRDRDKEVNFTSMFQKYPKLLILFITHATTEQKRALFENHPEAFSRLSQKRFDSFRISIQETKEREPKIEKPKASVNPDKTPFRNAKQVSPVQHSPTPTDQEAICSTPDKPEDPLRKALRSADKGLEGVSGFETRPRPESLGIRSSFSRKDVDTIDERISVLNLALDDRDLFQNYLKNTKNRRFLKTIILWNRYLFEVLLEKQPHILYRLLERDRNLGKALSKKYPDLLHIDSKRKINFTTVDDDKMKEKPDPTVIEFKLENIDGDLSQSDQTPTKKKPSWLARLATFLLR